MKWTERISEHYAATWACVGQTCSFTAGPIHQLPADFRVLAFPPHAGRNVWTYATCGMCQPADERPLELHLFSPHTAEEVVELLVATAHFHRTGKRLDVGHTVHFGRPWLGTSACTHGLISLPYLDGPQLENLSIDRRNVKFYWLIPITADELAMKKSAGVNALEARFEAANFEYANPARHSVV